MSILNSTVPLINEQFLKQIQDAHPVIKPAPNVTTIEELMFNAGQQELLAWIIAKATR